MVSKDLNKNSMIANEKKEITGLKHRDFKGSRYRFLLMTHQPQAHFAHQLQTILGSEIKLPEPDNIQCAPQGFLKPEEVLFNRDVRFLELDQRKKLLDWWLASWTQNTKTPHWDLIVKTKLQYTDPDCKQTEPRNALILFEGKAHYGELGEKDNTKANGENRKQINLALAEATEQLNTLFPEGGQKFNLTSNHHYQLSNRFAFAWKLADMGIPVVLVYLGFLNCNEMHANKEDHMFTRREEWLADLQKYGQKTVPESIWGRTLNVNGTPLTFLCEAVDVNP